MEKGRAERELGLVGHEGIERRSQTKPTWSVRGVVQTRKSRERGKDVQQESVPWTEKKLSTRKWGEHAVV